MKNDQYTIPLASGDASFPSGELGLACTAEGWNGNALVGQLVDFNVEQRLLKIQSRAEQRRLTLRFNQVKRLKFDLQPDIDVDFEPSSLTAGENGRSDLASFVIQLKDGALFSGIARAYRKEPYGLWLFPKKTLDTDPFRVFVPRAAINRFELKNGEAPKSDDADTDYIDFNDTVTAEIESFGLDAVIGSGPSMVESPEQLLEALNNQASLKPVPLGEALLGLGKITADQLMQALRQQKEKKSQPLGQMLVAMGLVTPADLQTAFARKMGYPFIDLQKFPIDVEALRLVPASLAGRLKVLPLMEMNSAIVVAMPDPLQFKIIEQLEFTTQRKIIPVVIAVADMAARIAKAYKSIGSDSHSPSIRPAEVEEERSLGVGPGLDAQQLVAELDSDVDEGEEDRQIEQSDNTLVKLINSMITEAHQQGASDIHIEPYPGRAKMLVRFRVDGDMRPYLELPSSYRSALIARIKIMCNLDISEKRRPQDGKINFSKFGGIPIELRVATIPTVNGLEDVVMRILASSKAVSMEKLNLSPSNLKSIETMINRPYGLFLCVGPTGSGKTTALHAALHHINQPHRKIWTAEDPVEITQRGLRQIQVNPKIGWTFAAALRSLLRADPDVIMVGEIRDAETAEIAVEASLTGHLVLSTLHTNSAPETITRLNDLGVDPFSFADSLLGVLAQRLVRRYCSDCVKSEPIDKGRLKELVADYQQPLPSEHLLRDEEALVREWTKHYGRNGKLMAYHAPGCEKCGNTGYRGRLAIHELLTATPGVKRLVQTKARPEEIQAAGLQESMRTLRQDGIEKVLMGLTSLAEVRSTSNA